MNLNELLRDWDGGYKRRVCDVLGPQRPQAFDQSDNRNHLGPAFPGKPAEGRQLIPAVIMCFDETVSGQMIDGPHQVVVTPAPSAIAQLL